MAFITGDGTKIIGIYRRGTTTKIRKEILILSRTRPLNQWRETTCRETNVNSLRWGTTSTSFSLQSRRQNQIWKRRRHAPPLAETPAAAPGAGRMLRLRCSCESCRIAAAQPQSGGVAAVLGRTAALSPEDGEEAVRWRIACPLRRRQRRLRRRSPASSSGRVGTSGDGLRRSLS